ncbi:MAG: alpha/beta fold hydrolase [Pseudomonadota bacterium]
MAHNRITISSPTGASLNTYVHTPLRQPKAILHINHGLAEHAARYKPHLAWLANEGFAAIAHDHRGHGRTEAVDAPPGHFGDKAGANVLADAHAVWAWAKERWPGTPLFVFGHSMGGLVALNSVMRAPQGVAGLAVWNSNAAPGLLGRLGQLIINAECAVRGSHRVSQTMPALTFGAWWRKMKKPRTAFDWLSRDPSVVDAYIADPLCGWHPSIGMWQAILGWARSAEQRPKLRQLPRSLPIYILGGSADPATENGAACRRFAHLLQRDGRKGVRLDIVAGARHETLNDRGREKALIGLRQWINESVAQRQPTPAMGARLVRR